MVLPFGVGHGRLHVVYGDQRTTGIEGRRAEALCCGLDALTLVRETETHEAIDLLAKRPVALDSPTFECSCHVGIEDDGSTHASKHTRQCAYVRQATVIQPTIYKNGSSETRKAR